MKAKPRLSPEVLKQRRVERPEKAMRNKIDSYVEKESELAEARYCWARMCRPNFNSNNARDSLDAFKWRLAVSKQGLIPCTYNVFPETAYEAPRKSALRLFMERLL